MAGVTQAEEQYILDNQNELMELLEQLCGIPAPSNYEEKRAVFCKDWLEKQGAKGVYIDSALNVVYPVNCENSSNIVVFLAHMDTVFPDLDPMPYRIEAEKIFSPGVGDNTISLAIMLMVVKYILINNKTAQRGLLFVANSGEEGLGNLKGIRKITEDYSGRISEVFSFDNCFSVADRCVGSHRYQVDIQTEGGHSFKKFGNRNAIYFMSKLIYELYKIQVPKTGESTTTYNVGIITGGTSVNTIAENASMLYEYRSDSAECLDQMRWYFEAEIEKVKNEGVQIDVKLIGSRPCMGNVDMNRQEALVQKCVDITAKHINAPVLRHSCSTDCNIPLSQGIPAVCLGVAEGGGGHTRNEWIKRSSIPVGMRISLELILSYFN